MSSVAGSSTAAPDPFAAPVAQLLTGDDQADTAAALWAGRWGSIWAPTTVAVRTVPAVVAMAPSLAVVGLPVAGTSHFVSTATAIVAACNVATACVPWYLAEAAGTPPGVDHAVVAVLWDGDTARVSAAAHLVAQATGLRLSALEVDGSPADHTVAAARLAAEEHLASVLVVGVGRGPDDGPARWIATHTIAPTILVPTAPAAELRTPPPGSDAPSRVSPTGPRRSS